MWNRKGRLWLREGAPHLWTRRPKFCEIVLRAPKTRVEGIFREVALIHPATGDVVKSYGPFKNLILNQGLDKINATVLSGAIAVNQFGDGVTMRCAVGTGSVAPAETQTTLQNELGHTSDRAGFDNFRGMDASGDYWRCIETYVFGTAEVNGNLTELGVRNATATDDLFNRQLIRDALGEPTTLTKTSDYQLRVIFELRVYPPWGDSVDEVTVDGTTRDVTRRVAASGSWNTHFQMGTSFNATLTNTSGPRLWRGTFQAEGAVPTMDVSALQTSSEFPAYVAGSFQREVSNIYGPAVANDATGYQGFLTSWLSGSGVRAIKFEWDGAPITKDEDYRFVVHSTRSWGRAVV